ncbi:hypothetical protein ACRZ5S_22280 (plasmid) [Vibrio scophthalmi]|uniref:hypothetical protein n=1 Tax=Vibrio scophthalmi TaxID=45658 RepID=UPI003EBC267D
MNTLGKTLTLTAAITTALLGCSSQPNHAMQAQQIAEAKLEQSIERVDETISTMPNWYLNTPESNDMGFYAAGTGASSTIEMAVTKARINSEFELAKKYKQIISGVERSYSSEVTNSQTDSSKVVTTTEQTIDKLVANAQLSNYKIEETKVLREGSKYRVYLLTFINYDQNNDGSDELYREVKSEAREAFQDLERRVDKVTEQSTQIPTVPATDSEG